MQHLGLLTVLLLAAGLAFTVTKWPGGQHMTFSQHAAASRLSRIFYSILFIILLPTLYLFFILWLVPFKGLPSAFLWFAVVSILFQIVSSWFPDAGGKKAFVLRYCCRLVISRCFSALFCLLLMPRTYGGIAHFQQEQVLSFAYYPFLSISNSDK